MEAAESRQPTIFDVAAEAGVSKSMVSRVMRGEGGVRQEKVDRVLAAAEKLGYVPSAMASGLASKRTKTLGVVVRNAKLPFYGFLQGAMQKRARERGYQMVSISGVEELSADDARQALRDLIALRVEGADRMLRHACGGGFHAVHRPDPVRDGRARGHDAHRVLGVLR